MVYIKGIKLRGFKSFKRTEATFPNSFVCLAGPNGGGKSNVTDAIRFALGEASLKALRAKRVADLINTSCKFAEVTLYIGGEKQFEIKRAINPEGKTLYRVNGKRSTRTLVLEELCQYGIEAGTHNIIAQGQVQKIVEMNSKERRQIIDSVAGISEFDAKKEEALRELSAVEQKITEASIVLGERQAVLGELEKEKNDALSYLDAQQSFKRAKASLANREYNKLSNSFNDIIEKYTKAAGEQEELEKQYSVLLAKIDELTAQKQQVVSKLGTSASREAMLKEIEELKVKMGADSATLFERRRESERLSSSSKNLEAQIASLKKSQKENSAEIVKLSAELSDASGKISEFEKKGIRAEAKDLSWEIELLSEKIVSLKEKKAATESSLSDTQKMLEMKKQEKGRFVVPQENLEKLKGESNLLKEEIKARQKELDSLFEQEKEINRSLPELDKRLLALKEKAAMLRATLSPSSASSAVEEMKKSIRGIFGHVSSLIKCEQKYNIAVEAAAGQRLNYIVVDSMETAISAIEKLKAQKSGRATFIPQNISQQKLTKEEKLPQGCLGYLIDFVDFELQYKQAMDYVFSDTLLFESVHSAVKAGIGKRRMVTLDGELIEKSGTISGGTIRTSILSRSSLEKIEGEIEATKKERDLLYSKLYSLRDNMSAKRREKADAEVKLRAIEIELESISKSNEKNSRAISEIEKEIISIEKAISELKDACASLEKEQKTASEELQKKKQAQNALQEKEKQETEKLQKQLQELHSIRSSTEAKLSAKKEEIERISLQQSEKEKEAHEISSLLSDCKKDISALEHSIAQAQKQLKEKEGKLSEISSASQKLYAKLTELEAQIADISSHLGKIKFEVDKKGKELTSLEINKQTTQTRLADLKAELEEYGNAQPIEASKAELEELMKRSQSTMDSLGNVNLRAPELFEQKKKDIEEIKGRVTSLDEERRAVLRMMDEIEARKREIFLSTFSAINEKFRQLFSSILPGEGTLLLEQPSNPFEGGLFIKVRDGKHEKYIEAMSGGEKSLLALIFIFSIQMHKAAPFYILDEADAGLDKENSKKLAELIKKLSSKTQFIVVTHNDTVLSSANVALGVTKTNEGSKIVGVELVSTASVAKRA